MLGEAPDHLGRRAASSPATRWPRTRPTSSRRPTRSSAPAPVDSSGTSCRDAHPRVAGEVARRTRRGSPPRGGSRAPRASASRSSSTSARASRPFSASAENIAYITSAASRSSSIASLTPGNCTLTASSPTAAVGGAVHLTDARRRDRQVVPRGEHPLRVGAELLADHRRGERRRHRRGVGLQRGERLLGLVGQALGDEADHLADLHQHALHLAQLGGDVLGGADGELQVELGAPLGGRDDAPRPSAGVAAGAARRHPPHPP